MQSLIKHIYISLLIAIFLLPSTGIMLYVQKCNMSQKTTIELEESDLCCSAFQSNDNHETSSDLIKEFIATGANFSVLSQLPCCKNEKLFVKLGNQLISKSLTLLKDYTHVVINIISFQQSQFVVADIVNDISLAIRPPGLPVYIEHSSLRL